MKKKFPVQIFWNVKQRECIKDPQRNTFDVKGSRWKKGQEWCGRLDYGINNCDKL